MHVTETRYLYSFHLLQITIFRMDEDGIDIDIAILKALLKGLFRGRPGILGIKMTKEGWELSETFLKNPFPLLVILKFVNKVN